MQEALTNVARHAQANRVLIRIEYRDETLALRVRAPYIVVVIAGAATAAGLRALGLP